jgi:hypothetical protein
VAKAKNKKVMVPKDDGTIDLRHPHDE